MLGRTKGYGGAILLSTQKVTDENWRDIGKDRLLAINCGEILIRSDEIILKSWNLMLHILTLLNFV